MSTPSSDDRVDEAILESFPASDPPAWTGAVSAPTEAREHGSSADVAPEDHEPPQDGREPPH